jgi:ribosome biogenesis GTPase
LINALEPEASAETGELSRKTSRGKHTTRHTEIFETGGGAMIYDTPGFTSFDVSGVSGDELKHLFPELETLYGKCKFRDCAHIRETGCSVLEAVNSGVIGKSRYCSYMEIHKEIEDNRIF